MSTRLIPLLLAALLPALPLSAKVSEEIRQSHPLAANGSLELSNTNGRISIEAWDKPEVEFVAIKSADDAEGLKSIDILVDASPEALRIDTKHATRFLHRSSGSVSYALKVPAGAVIKHVSSVNSKVEISGVAGPVKAKTVNGSISVTGLRADAELETVNGSLKAEMLALPAGARVILKTVNGSISLQVPEESGAQLNAKTVNGSIRCALPMTVESSSRRELRGKIGKGGADISLRSVNGSLEVQKP